MSEVILVVILILVLANVGVIFYFVKEQLKSKTDDLHGQGEGLNLLLQQMNELSRSMDERIGKTSKEMQESLRLQSSESYKVIRDITERLTRLDEANKQVVSLGDRIQSLQDILKNPKQRGVLGEYYLETLLKNILPPQNYQIQYNLGKDEATGADLIVDAVVFVRDKVIPIDSKFSLENYNRLAEERDEVRKGSLEKLFINDLKERIKETSKYIQPEKGTLDFAFMFIPHEAIYYDLLVNKIGSKTVEGDENLIEVAARKYRVMIVSPTSFLAYLQTVLQGLKAMQIEERTKDIIKRVTELGKHIGAHDKYMTSLGKNLGTAVNQYNLAYGELKKVDKDVYRITDESIGIEPLAIEKPEV